MYGTYHFAIYDANGVLWGFHETWRLRATVHADGRTLRDELTEARRLAAEFGGTVGLAQSWRPRNEF